MLLSSPCLFIIVVLVTVLSLVSEFYRVHFVELEKESVEEREVKVVWQRPRPPAGWQYYLDR